MQVGARPGPGSRPRRLPPEPAHVQHPLRRFAATDCATPRHADPGLPAVGPGTPLGGRRPIDGGGISARAASSPPISTMNIAAPRGWHAQPPRDHWPESSNRTQHALKTTGGTAQPTMIPGRQVRRHAPPPLV